MTTAPTAVPVAPVDRRRWILIATIIGSSMTFVDGTVVNIALPTIGRDLDAGLSAQQWVMLSYSLAVASLYIVSGALGDRYGRWVLFVCGVAGFAGASALAGLAPNTALLVAGRVLQGIAGALLTTNSLALLRATYAEDSGRAVGQWTAWSGIGTMIGPPLGGLLVEYASWRWIFFINLPAAALALAMAFAGRGHEQPPEEVRPVQWSAAAAIAVTFGALTYGLIDGAQAGFALGLVGVRAGGRRPGAARRASSGGRAARSCRPSSCASGCSWSRTSTPCSCTRRSAARRSTSPCTCSRAPSATTPARASLVFLPISIVMFVLAARFGRLADRDGPRRYLTIAPIVMAAGFVLLTLVTSTNPLVPLPGVLVMAVGLAMLVAPITATALRAAPDRYAGLAAGVNTTVSRLGGLIATPLIGVAITLVFAAAAPHPAAGPFATHAALGRSARRDGDGVPGRDRRGGRRCASPGPLLAARGLRADDR